MSRAWNGLALQTEFSAALGDTGTTFKLKVLGWMNDIIEDIGSAHRWSYLRAMGLKILTSGEVEQDLFIAPPSAPTLAALSGGSLTLASSFKVLVTFLEGVSGAESIAGTASAALVTAGANLSITLTAIGVSTNTLVTARRIYLQKDSGDWLLYSTISDNTTTTTTITSEPASTAIQPPDHNNIREIEGEPWIQTSSQLKHKPLDQLRLLFQGTWGSGSPQYWDLVTHEHIALYPAPSSALTIRFYYYRFPARVFATATSYPDLPIFLKPALYLGVLWKGRNYRERAGRDLDLAAYERKKIELISTFGKGRSGPSYIRDVVGNSDRQELN